MLCLLVGCFTRQTCHVHSPSLSNDSGGILCSVFDMCMHVFACKSLMLLMFVLTDANEATYSIGFGFNFSW